MFNMETSTPSKPVQQPILTRVRVIFIKSGSLIYTGALDLQKIWERVLRRAKFPVAYTQGFSPGPRINLASALPLGVAGNHEMADFWFNETPEMESFCELVNLAAPVGLRAITAEIVPLPSPALQTRVEAAEYQTGMLSSDEFLQAVNSITSLMAAETLPRERRGKPYDLRPLIISLVAQPENIGGGHIEMTLQAREGATGRADEVLSALGMDPSTVVISRTKITLKSDSPVVK
jgi:radical SAM-linked protein